ncbi:MAG: aminoglycoside phosphotransferase family protein, partial [Lewinella sp.]|nr:aminoglycoside phosphotransferase family protein [Lewinella sp.]
MQGDTTVQAEHLAHQFQLEGSIESITVFGTGHINDTFRIKNSDTTAPDYLLQRINHLVFPDVGPMMENIAKVTEHLKAKSSSQYTSLTIIPTREGRLFCKDEHGNYWRIFIFMKDLISYDIVETTEQIYEGGKAFGAFLRDLSDISAADLFTTLSRFHDVPWRVGNLRQAVKRNVKNREEASRKLIRFAFDQAERMSQVQKLGDQGRLPLRVTHNDTKFNNVLLDRNGKGRCVIDLDTVMPGYVHFDFGDGVRTSVSTAAEDEKDIDKIQIDLKRFEAYSNGYLEATRNILTPLELELLPLAGAMLAYIMGIRFLTDFLMG